MTKHLNINNLNIFLIVVICIGSIFNIFIKTLDANSLNNGDSLDSIFNNSYSCIVDEMFVNDVVASRYNKDINFDGINDYYQSKVYSNNNLRVNLVEIFENNYFLTFKDNSPIFDGLRFNNINDQSNNIFSLNINKLEIILKESNNIMLILSQNQQHVNFICNKDEKSITPSTRSKNILKKIFN